MGYYIIGFPIGVALMFAANMGIVGKNRASMVSSAIYVGSTEYAFKVSPIFVTGLWTGLTICVLMQSTFFIIFIYRLNWKKSAEEVRTYIRVLHWVG